MSTSETSTASTRAHATDSPGPVAAARALRPAIEAAADQIERDRRLPPELVASLLDAGLFSMLLPASLGGAELDLPTFASAVEELARADGSVAWCVGQANGLASHMAYAERGAARELFSATSERLTTFANGPGEGNRPGRAVRTPNGWMVSGRWMFASGIGHATWLMAICNIFEEGADEPRLDATGSREQWLMIVPKDAATLHDTWHVSGLRGTGSQSFSLSEVFVPSTYAVLVEPSQRREPGPLYRFNSNAMFGPAFGSVSLGLAQASLSALIDMAGAKVPRGAAGAIRDSAAVQSAVAVAHARLGAARAYLQQTLSDVWTEVVRNGEVQLDHQVRIRLAATHATHESAAVVDTAYTLAGSHAIFENRPFERRFRDVHAVTQQVQARRAHYDTVGKYLLGIEPERGFL